MNKGKLISSFVAICLFFANQVEVNAQCPVSVTANILTQTVATCPSNATVTIGSNANGNASATYNIVSGPTGVSLAAQSSNVFTSLPPGNYSFKVTCGASNATINTVITSTYTQLTGTAVVSNICNSYLAGGTVTASATGGTLPYKYSLIKTTNANYSDALSVYGNSNVLNATDSGTFPLRIKDNCGNFITKTVLIQPNVPALYFQPEYLENDQPCGSGNISLYFTLNDVNGTGVNLDDLVYGFRVDIYKKGAGVGCTRGAFIKTVNFVQGQYAPVIIPRNQNLYIKVTNSCGDTTSGCHIYPTGSDIYKAHWEMVQTGCASVANPNGLVTLGYNWSEYPSYPEKFSLIKLNGTVVRAQTPDSSSFHNLPYGIYVVVGQDACGTISKDTLYPPTVGTPPSLSEWSDLICTNQTGTATYYAKVGGFIFDLEHAVITITSGPSNVGVVGSLGDSVGIVTWLNMLPGNYTASIVTPCETKSVSFTLNAAGLEVLQQSMVVNTFQACNNGGSINAQLTYNGFGTSTYKLYNALGTNIATNSSGSFDAIPAGNYTVKGVIQQNGSCSGTSYSIDRPVTILPDGAPPLVSKKITMICEDAVGTPLANGKSIISGNGFAPFKVEVKKVVDPDANYVLKFASSVSDFTVDNLSAYENYRIRITDQCGNTALTDVSVGIMEQLTAINNGNPCINKPYTLSAPDMIDATYTWRKGSTIVGTSREIIFPSYAASNDGTYTCTISIGGGCVTRTVTNNLAGSICSILPVKIESFTGNTQPCKNILNWKLANANGPIKISLEKSNDGIGFASIKKFEMIPLTNSTQTAVDADINSANSYYRLMITEADGSTSLSNIVALKNNCTVLQNQLAVYPNPAFENSNFSIDINSHEMGTADCRIMNNLGEMVSKKRIDLKNGMNTIQYNSSELKSGIYFVMVVLPSGEILKQKLVRP